MSREQGGFEAEPAIFDNDIAIVGMAGRFPGAPDVATLWRNLREGVESVVEFSDAELLAAGVPKSLLSDPDYVKRGAPLADMDMFDAGLFGLTPREAAIMDPQHRHFLECAWEAIEDAGYDVGRFPGPVGVFGGSGHNAYFARNLLTNPDLVRSTGMFMLRHTGNDKDFLTTRLSYLLNLKGPSVAVQTACSTSLVAIHLACQSLLALECDMALAGGVTIELPHRQGYLHEPGGINSADGHCRPFSNSASGTIFGSGAGVVVLRRLHDAIASGDHVYAVIKGSAINNDGSGKVGYFAPSVDGQTHAIVEAQTLAGVSPDTISYVEAHGTGTAVGDPIEVAALTQAFRAGTDQTNFCAIGSIKGNIGHLDTAAGIAGIIKVAMALREGELPPSINCGEPSDACGFDHSPFHVVTSLRPWIGTAGAPRRAGVSSLGVGGTNAHIVLEQPPKRRAPPISNRPHLLVLSAASSTALDANTSALAEHLAAHPELDLGSVAHTLQVGRAMLPYRRCVVVADREEAIELLGAQASDRVYSRHAPASEDEIAFMFAGGGAQHPNMGRDLYINEPVFRDAVDECLRLIGDQAAAEIRAALYPMAGAESDAAATLERPSIGLPALFIIQYAQAQLWRSWGVVPSGMIGHSMGEYVAAHLAGVFSLRDALRLVEVRGQLFETLPAGAMLSVPLDAATLAPMLSADLSIAAINGANATVVSGPSPAILALQAKLAEIETPCSLLRIKVAAHSAMLDGVLPAFADFLATVRFQPPVLPFVSSLTGTWITAAQAQDPAYWVRHLRETVNFHGGLTHLLGEGNRALLEVGPGRVLSGHALQHPKRSKLQPVVHSSRTVDAQVNDVTHMLDALGRLWAAGAPVYFGFLQADGKQLRVSLPTYRFDHARHWIEPGRGAAVSDADEAGGRSDDVTEWIYRPTWSKAQAAKSGATPGLHVLVFVDASGLGAKLAQTCRARGDNVVTVRAGRRFSRDSDDAFTIRCDAPDDVTRMIASLTAEDRTPNQIFHLWTVSGPTAGKHALKSLDQTLSASFYSLLHLAQALGSEADSAPIELVVVSDGMQRVCGEHVTSPAKATLLGPCRVIPRELPNIRARSLDIVLPPRETIAEARLVEAMLAEPFAEDHAETVALRLGERWIQSFESVAPQSQSERGASLKQGGTYVVTGGLGDLGLAVAHHLGAPAGERIALLSRRALPPRSSWAGVVAGGTGDARVIRQILAIEQAGGTVLPIAVDVCDLPAMRRAIRQARDAFGPISGAFHNAGILDDQLLQLKDAAAAARVLAPKVRGTLNLQTALEQERPDFVMLFSSISASLGAAGQIDYAAANAFLDAVAQASLSEGGNVISVDWSQWREIGMAADLARGGMRAEARPPVDALAAPSHPLLDRCLLDTPNERRYATQFGAARHWLVDEHRVLEGGALIPGTGYIELVRAAAHEEAGQMTSMFDIKDVLFLEPFFVDDGGERELEVRLQRGASSGWNFELVSQASSGELTAHVSGHVGVATCVEPDRQAIAEFRARCERPVAVIPSAHMRFGPRWSNVTQIHIGDGEALIGLRLPDAFVDDLDSMVVHPALLDMATAGAQMIVPGLDPAQDFFVPASYGRIRVYRPMVSVMFSHVRLRREASSHDVASYDVTICDEHGLVVVEISNFTMIRLRDWATAQAPAATRSTDKAAFEAAAELGILPDEGLSAIDYLLTHPLGPQLVVAPQNFVAMLAEARKPLASGGPRDTASNIDDDGAGLSETERLIAEMWRDMLGVDRVLPADNFFDLGGHSLLALQFVNKLRKRLGVPVPATALIESPTLAGLAARFAPEKAEDLEQGGARALDQGEAAVLLSPGGNGTPLFLVHDGLGEILLYRTLAQRLDPARPIYGLPPTVRADGSIVHTEITTMAAAHIAKLREVQPQGPYMLAGLCAGGVIAYEMARQLEDLGDTVWFVGIIDAADVAARERPFFVARLRMKRFARALAASRQAGTAAVGKEVARRIGRLMSYEIAERIRSRQTRAQLKQLRNEAPVAAPPTAAQNASLPFLDIYKVAHREHRPHGLLHGAHVVLYRALTGNGAHDDMPFYEQFSDCALGWGKRVADGLDILPVPGGHVSALQEPHVATLAEVMQDGIDAALVRGEARARSGQASNQEYEMPEPVAELVQS